MKNVEIYTKSYCPYSLRAKELLKAKGVDFTEYDISDDPEKAKEMKERSGRSTVPEIFADGELLGGCDDIMALEDRGELDGRLGLH